MFNALELNITTEYGIHYFIEFVRVVYSRFEIDFLAFWTFGLDIVLPKMSLLFATRGRTPGGVEFGG